MYMKPLQVLLTIMSALLLQAMPASAQREVPLRKIRAEKQTTELTLLDKIESDTRRKIYQYNEYGYITSVMEYSKAANEQTWQLSTDQSYIQEYTFDDNGWCTSRIKYNVDSNGNKTTVVDKGEATVENGQVWERYYMTDNSRNSHLKWASAYDQWDNKVVEIVYGYDEDENKEYIEEYTERKYTGPVDKYASHYHYNQIASTMLVYELRAVPYWGEKPTNVNDLQVLNWYKTEWQTIGNKLYHLIYRKPDEISTVGELAGKTMVKEEEEEYLLNADGTRPVSVIRRRFYDMNSTSPDYETIIENTYTCEWDSYGRLLNLTIYHGSSELERTEQYTYADNYAKQLTAQEAAMAIGIDLRGGLPYYFPEDDDLFCGHVSTYKFSYYLYDKGTEEGTYVWDADGRLTGGTWKETGEWYDPDNDTTHPYTENGEVRVGYNSDGHMAWQIDHNISDGDFWKNEYVYDRGMWIGVREYSGESFDGPWILEYETLDNYRTRHKSKSRAVAKSPAFVDDLSEGFHNIEHNDGVWSSYGAYFVEGGIVRDGHLYQSLVSNAVVPSNPENNYTDPLMPYAGLENEDAFSVGTQGWVYSWSVDDNNWECASAPQSATRVYAMDDHIVSDQYNSNKEIVNSTSYYSDSEGRLIEERNSQGGGITYEYLSGTDNYLLESVKTDADGTRHVCHYYYSKHNYVDPTGINEVEASRTADNKCYDLQGRHVSTPTAHGIYIINGKKICK